jgi:glutamate synthase (ferredoxin)
MSGGVAYLYDPQKIAAQTISNEDLNLLAVESDQDKVELHQLLESHYNHTMSSKAEKLLMNWEDELKNFVKVLPEEYRQALMRIEKENEAINN